MSNEKKQSTALVPTNLAEAQQMSAVYAKSSLLPPDLRGKEADVFVTIMAGQELGLAPMASLRSIHVVKGKPILSADAMVGVALASGVAEYFINVESSDKVATYETKRRGSPAPQRLSFTIDEAKLAGLGGDNWKKYPAAMLRARAKAALARDAYPDALAGVYIEDEAREFEAPRQVAAAPAQFRAPEPAAVIDVEVADEPRSLLEAILTAESEAALNDVAAKIAKQADAVRKELKPHWVAKRDQLRRISAATEAEIAGEVAS